MTNLSAAIWMIGLLCFGPATVALGYAIRDHADNAPILLVGGLITLCVDGTYIAIMMFFLVR